MVRLEDIVFQSVEKKRLKHSGKKKVHITWKSFCGEKALSAKRKAFFYTELAMLLNSGIDLKNGLNIIREEQVKGVEQQLFLTLYNFLIAGKSLYESFSLSGQFSLYEQYSVKIGEETGRLPRVLKELSDYYTGLVEQGKKIKSAFSYPLVVVSVAILVIAFMVEFIVPMFEGVFARFGRELPFLTRCVLVFASFWRGNFFQMITVFIFTGYVLVRLSRRPLVKVYLSKILLKIPILNRLVMAFYMNRFCLTMSLLTGAGIPLLRSVGMVKEMLSFLPLQMALNEIESDILRGKSLHESMSKHAFFDRRMCMLIKLGEEINGLEDTFRRLGTQYKEELQYRMELMNKLLEPLLIVFIGSLVALILVAMYLPMFSMGNSLYI